MSAYNYICLSKWGLNLVDVLEDAFHLCMDLTTQFPACLGVVEFMGITSSHLEYASTTIKNVAPRKRPKNLNEANARTGLASSTHV